ncbi:MAG: C69 family dipeptidase [Thermofilum sp.]
MCDTLVALKDATRGGFTIFAKNSDREPNEAQVVEFHPRRSTAEERVKCTYIEVEQVDEVYAVLICRPYWMWGAEMGVNEHGVAIGNEAVFTREPYSRKGLTGMDLVRLALERSRNAKEAVDWITRLIEEHGQGGSCSAARSFYYHNSFLIADPGSAWVLETAGREWVAKRVSDVASISNALSISSDWDSASRKVAELASKGEANFARRYSDWFYTRMAKGRERQAFTMGKLREAKGSIDFFFAANLLRSHSFEPYDPSRGSMRDVCMHAGGLARPSQTACSLIALLYDRAPLAFTTGTSTPCISMFKPVLLDAGLPDLGPPPTGKYDGGRSYWWRHEALSRRINCSYQRYAPQIAAELGELEREFYTRALSLREAYLRGEASADALRKLTLEAFEAAAKVEEKWLQRSKPGRCFNPFYASYWRKVNKAAGL